MTVVGIREIKKEFIDSYEAVIKAEENNGGNEAMLMDLREDMEFAGGMLFRSLGDKERKHIKTWGDLYEYVTK